MKRESLRLQCICGYAEDFVGCLILKFTTTFRICTGSFSLSNTQECFILSLSWSMFGHCHVMAVPPFVPHRLHRSCMHLQVYEFISVSFVFCESPILTFPLIPSLTHLLSF